MADMAQDFINDLPTELLHQVFECLDHNELRTAAAICIHWSDILSSERYREPTELESYYVTSHLFDTGRFRSLEIDFLPHRPKVIGLLESYMILSNLEKLYMSSNTWQKLFASQEELHFPKLREIIFRKIGHNERNILLDPFLPNLNHLQRKWQLGDQIVTLEIADCPLIVLPKSGLFPNLRSLILRHIIDVTYEDQDSFMMGRLTELNIYRVNILNLKILLKNARALESLSIYDQFPIPGDTYEAINNMKKLKQLSLIIPIDNNAKGLSLPLLNHLTISHNGFIPLQDVPNVRSLCIRENCWSNSKEVNYRLFANSLQHLTLRNLFLNKDHVSQIYALLTNLQTLKLEFCEVELVYVEEMCQSIVHLKLLRLRSCIVSSENFECDDCHQQYVRLEDCEKMTKYFSNLRTQYLHCAIATEKCEINLAFRRYES